jgi:predicted ArsR family transcriptional regulator
MKNALLLILQQNGPSYTNDLAALLECSSNAVLKHMGQLLSEGKVTKTTGAHNTYKWEMVPVVEPAKATVHTLHRRRIVSLFNPVELAN